MVIFESNTQPKNPNQEYLLTMDGHRNHVIVNFIAYCIKRVINLFILPPHTLHFFQLFNVSVFAPLKYILIEKIDRIFRHNSGCIS